MSAPHYGDAQMVKILVLLVVLALLMRRLLPRRRLPWSIPLIVVGVVLTVRTLTYLTSR